MAADILAKLIDGITYGTADQYGNIFEEPVSLRAGTEVQGNCSIGARTEINDATVYPRTRIGRYCSIARGAALGAPDHPISCIGTSLSLLGTMASLNLKTTEIGADVWVGANAVVLAGVTVGPGAIIAAGAIVTHDVPPYAIMVGVPAKISRKRFSDAICDELVRLAWWEFEHDRVSTLPHADTEQCIATIRMWRSEMAPGH